MQKADFFSNVGGLNLTDSPFYVKENQASGGSNYDYTKTGAISKRRGLQLVNTTPDTQTRTLSLGLHHTVGGTKTVVRAAGTKFQTVDVDTPTFADKSEDTAVSNSTFFSSSSYQPVEMANFVTADASVVWAAGGGASYVYGYNGTNVTKNGVPAPTGTFSKANQGSGTGGTWAATGTYFYSLGLRKTGTQARSNASLDGSVTISNTTDSVLLTFPTGIDTTKYDKWIIYRSAVGGVTSFTTGSIVALVDTTQASYTDTGTSTADAQNIPRAGGTVDNSELASGTVKYITIFKRRLIAAINSTVYLSDLDKPESWPTANYITIPTGGPITGLAVLGSNAPLSTSTDEYLVIFKERETWIITGSSSSDWALKFIDNVGCANQSLVVSGNGYLSWVDYRGIYIWNGNGKPIYCSRPIEALFSFDGDLDKTKLYYGWGKFDRKQNQIIWFMSHKTVGENKFSIKLDLRLTLPEVKQGMDSPVMEGVFIVDTYSSALYAGLSYLPSTTQEIFLVGDDSGFLYKNYSSAKDVEEGIDFSYITKFLDMQTPGQAKRFHKVIVWVDEAGPWDLTLDYWANYRVRSEDKSTADDTLDANNPIPAALWDLAIWDKSEWDDYTPKQKALIYNLNSGKNNNEGDCLLLKFIQNEADAPVTIHGFSVLYELLPIRK